MDLTHQIDIRQNSSDKYPGEILVKGSTDISPTDIPMKYKTHRVSLQGGGECIDEEKPAQWRAIY